ncbi:MAG: NAD(P)/FAD-dependent oxidoreductase [Lishizhenia sp.]
MDSLNVAVIGGGAAGFFSALSVKHHHPKANVTLFEKSKNVLAKVKISGGGRCNLTNATFDIRKLAKNYPRGENQLKKAFSQFAVQDTLNWFEERGVLTYTLPDNCIFPKSDSSQTIIDCFLNEALKYKVEIKTNTAVRKLTPTENDKFSIETDENKQFFDKVIIATGGQPKRSGLEWLEQLGLKIESPVPSLFTFNMPQNPIRELMGCVVENTIVKVEGTKLIGDGPTLITHWGMSGPAILKLSAWGARILADKNYEFAVLVNWINNTNEEEVRKEINEGISKGGNKKLTSYNPFQITNRLWNFLTNKMGFSEETRWNELSKKSINKLFNTLTLDRYEVSGKTTFKEEFVTAGGVNLSEINFKTMAAKKYPNLYFTGEILDIDGITGGFNFQAAWTTGFIAGRLS